MVYNLLHYATHLGPGLVKVLAYEAMMADMQQYVMRLVEELRTAVEQNPY